MPEQATVILLAASVVLWAVVAWADHGGIDWDAPCTPGIKWVDNNGEHCFDLIEIEKRIKALEEKFEALTINQADGWLQNCKPCGNSLLCCTHDTEADDERG